MVIRQRAIQAEDKHERYLAILDAAERLLARSPDRVASVAEVADEAGLAKGTVYLYFPSKEELLLAVHERNVDAFFAALIARLEGKGPTAIEDILALAHRHIVQPPLFLPLAARCLGLMAQNIRSETSAAFMQRMAGRLERAGAGLERHFAELKAGDGVALLRHSYALIVGLWQMSATAGTEGAACLGSTSGGMQGGVARSYPEELDRALRSLWVGTVGPRSAPVPARPDAARGRG
jgi:AcrR family transcriptional regulator